MDTDKIMTLSTAEAIRRRPKMYGIDFDSPETLTKLIVEAMCLSRAMACGNAANEINIILKRNGEVEINDNGPGIEMKPQMPLNRTILESILTELHACRKLKHEHTKAFCEVGIIITNALCEYFTAYNKIDNKIYMVKYKNGKVEMPMKECGITYDTGLIFKFKFDKEMFGNTKIDKVHLKNAIDGIRAATPAKINLIIK